MSEKELDITYFISFCIEQYKMHTSKSGAEVIELFNHYGVDTYLLENYEVLHTQSRQWLMEEIDEFIQIRKETKS